MRYVLATTVLAIAAFTTPQISGAFQGSGAYVAADLGVSFVDLDDAEDDIRAVASDAGATDVSIDSDNGSPAFSLGAGYRFTRHVSAELNYYNAGEFEMVADASGGGATGTRTDRISFDGFGARVIGHIPLHRQWSLDVSAGVASMNAEREIDRFDNTSDRRTSTVTVPTFGLGTQFHIDRHWSVRGTYTHFFEAGDSSTSEGDVSMVTGGAVYRF